MNNADIIEARKIKLKEAVIKQRNWAQYILLAIIIWIGSNIRAKPLQHLIDPTTGKYITLELDSTLWLRYAKYIVENGRLYDIDPMRFYPLGGNINDLGLFTSYFVAYLYKFLKLFIDSITIEYVDIIYPIISTAILTIFLFLLLRRLFNWKVALLSVLFINIMPSFLFRSLGGSSDHDILAAMFVIMAFYFYVVGWQSKNIKYMMLFGIIAAFATVLARETAGAGNFVFLILGSFAIIEIFLNKFDKKDFYLYGSWLISVTIIDIYLHGFEKGFIIFISSITTGITYLAFLFALIKHIMFSTKLKRYSFKINLPESTIGIVVTLVFGSIFASLFFGTDFFIDKFKQLYGIFFKFYAETRWTLTVAENHRPYVTDWIGQMGKTFVYALILGTITLFYHMSKVFENKKISYFLTGTYTLFIFGYVFSRYSAGSVFNGISSASRLAFFSSVIGFLLIIIILYFRTYFKNKELYTKISLIDKKYAFILVWSLVMIFAATSAIRLLFEFSIIASILTSYFFISVLDYANKNKNKYIKYSILVVLLLILVNPFSYAQGIVIKNYKSSLNQATYSGPGYSQLWQLAGQWSRENTPKDAIFAHWWDYGYWVQSGFERATITDGGNFILWWNYLMGRNVLTAQNFTEPLGFLYAHDADYLLIVNDETGKYPAYSTIGSNENYDRRSFIPNYIMDQSGIQETRNGTTVVYKGGGFPLEDSFLYQNKLLPAGSAAIGGFIINIQQNNETITFSNPIAAVFYQNQRFDIPLGCLIIDNKRREFPIENDIKGCLKIIPIFQNDNNVNPIGAALYLSPRVKNSLFSRLYLNNEENEYFKLVYSTPGLPLGVYNGNLIGPIKVWEINYPKDIKLNEADKEYYLRTSYPDPRLYQI